MKVLICGATGFIGRNLAYHWVQKKGVDLTLQRFQRQAYPLQGASWVKADLTNPHQVDALVKGYDVVIQAAAVTSGAEDIMNRPYLHVTDNAIMNSLLLRSCHEHNVKHFVFFSCTVMYPNSDIPLQETDFDANQALYERYQGVGWTKVYIEKMCEFYASLGKLKTTAIRHSNVYGPFDKFDLKKSHVLGASITKVMQATNPGKIIMWGEGKEKRDVLYIDDLIDFVDQVIEKQPHPYRLYNCGSGCMMPVKKLVETIIAASGKSIQIDIDKSRPSLATGLCLNTSLAKKELGWIPTTPLLKGLKQTLAWWQESYAENTYKEFY